MSRRPWRATGKIERAYFRIADHRSAETLSSASNEIRG